jgi:two-component system, NarL family, nitrate/nitrite response regulator NarL
MKPITVLLADDHMVVREGLRALLKAEADLIVVGEASNGRLAVELTKKLRPAVVVMDLAMPQLNGLEATRQILLAVPATKVLILSAHSDDEYVERVIAAGAAGYLLKQSSAEILAQAIRAAEQGRPVFSAAIARRLHQGAGKPRAPGHAVGRRRSLLTSREEEVLQLVAEGAPNKQVATELGISIKTVEKHRQALMDKLAIHDTAGLTRYAIANGVIESSVQMTII